MFRSRSVSSSVPTKNPKIDDTSFSKFLVLFVHACARQGGTKIETQNSKLETVRSRLSGDNFSTARKCARKPESDETQKTADANQGCIFRKIWIPLRDPWSNYPAGQMIELLSLAPSVLISRKGVQGQRAFVYDGSALWSLAWRGSFRRPLIRLLGVGDEDVEIWCVKDKDIWMYRRFYEVNFSVTKRLESRFLFPSSTKNSNSQRCFQLHVAARTVQSGDHW